jgi:hypothetical protein
MTDDRVPAPIEALVRAIAGGARDDDDQRATTFARGLALGALVGAAIAGSTLWQRRHARRDHATAAEAARDDTARDVADRLTQT